MGQSPRGAGSGVSVTGYWSRLRSLLGGLQGLLAPVRAAGGHRSLGLAVVHRVEGGVDLVVKAAEPDLRRNLLHNGEGKRELPGGWD